MAAAGDHSGTGGSLGDLGLYSSKTVEASLSESKSSCRAATSSIVRGRAAPLWRVLDLDPLNDSIVEITNSPGSRELGAADSCIKS